MESARACTDAAALRRFAWRDYLSRGLVDEWDRTLQEAGANAQTSRVMQAIKHTSCMPPRRRLRSSERDAMCRSLVAVVDAKCPKEGNKGHDSREVNEKSDQVLKM